MRLYQTLQNWVWLSLISFRLHSVFQGPQFSKWSLCPPEPLSCIASSSLPVHWESWIRASFSKSFSKIHMRSQCAKDRNSIRIQIPFYTIQCSDNFRIVVQFSFVTYSYSFHNSLKHSERQDCPKTFGILGKLNHSILNNGFIPGINWFQ